MWATGCIIGEMYHGKPVLPGASTADQLERVGAVLGAPSAADLEAVGVAADALPPGLRTAPPPPRPLGAAFLATPAAAAARGLVASLLKFDPRSRAPAEAALGDAWVQEFHRSEEEPHHPEGPVRLPIDDDVLLSPADYRDRITLDVHGRARTREARRLHGRLEIGTCVEENSRSPSVAARNSRTPPARTPTPKADGDAGGDDEPAPDAPGEPDDAALANMNI